MNFDGRELLENYVKLRKESVAHKEVLKILHISDIRLKKLFEEFPELHEEYKNASKNGNCNPRRKRERDSCRDKVAIFMECFRKGERRDDIYRKLKIGDYLFKKILKEFPEYEKEYHEIAKYRMTHSGCSKTQEETDRILHEFINLKENGYSADKAYDILHTSKVFIEKEIKNYPELLERNRKCDLYRAELSKKKKIEEEELKKNKIKKSIYTKIKVDKEKKKEESKLKREQLLINFLKSLKDTNNIEVSLKEFTTTRGTINKTLKEFPKYKDEYDVLVKKCHEHYKERNKKKRLEKLLKIAPEISKKYIDGCPIAKLSKEYHLSSNTLNEILLLTNTPKRTKEELNLLEGIARCAIKTDDGWKEAYNYYLNDRSTQRTAKCFKVSEEVLSKNFKRLNLPLLKKDTMLYIKYKTSEGIKTVKDKDFWKKVYSYYQKHPVGEVEKHFKVKRQPLYNIFKYFNWTKRTLEEERELKTIHYGLIHKKITSLEEYELLDEFRGVSNNGNLIRYRFKHTKCGRVFSRTVNSIEGIRCYHCYPSSKNEVKLYEFLLKNNIRVIKGDRKLIHPKEIDLYLVDYNIALEYNGCYWHSEKVVSKKYHEDKTESCLKKGVKLYHFWSYQNFDIILSKINQLIGKCNTLFARKGTIKEVSVKERRNFFDRCHIHGDTNACVALGLYFEDKLEACMSFRHHKEGLELARFANNLNTTVIGGFSRLLKHSEYLIKEKFPKVKKIISYCDRDWTASFEDSIYYKNNFKFIKNTGYIMSYYNSKKGIVESRQKYQKHKLKKAFSDYNGEDVNKFLNSKQIYRIFNSGNWKFEKEIQ